MGENVRSVLWEAPEHNHIEKTADWYWILGIVAIAGAVASIIFDNVLFGIVILLGAVTMILSAGRHPRTIEFEVSQRGIRIENDLYPYSTLDSYYLDEESVTGFQMIVKSKKLFVPLLILPVPEEDIDTIETIVRARIPEEYLEEPFSHRLLEFFGF